MNWVYSGGTVVLSGNQRTASLSPAMDFIETTAGSDPRKTRIKSIADVNASISLLAQTGGTALEDALAEGTEGTLNVYPEGTSSTKRQYVVGAFSQGVKISLPYADVVELTCDFLGNGNYSRTTV
jgi:hypothetical protein